jgi:hypothetical protein
MGKHPKTGKPVNKPIAEAPPAGKPSALLDTRAIYCGDRLEQLMTARIME